MNLPGGTERILVVEDEPLVRKIVVRMLTGAGYEVLQAENGEEAVALMTSEEAKGVALVILDAVMPRMGGKEAYERIQPITTGVRFMFTSGYSADALPNDFIEKEQLFLLQKPYDPKKLLTVVRQVLDE
jgi:CheY-like chemotaxis protein